MKILELLGKREKQGVKTCHKSVTVLPLRWRVGKCESLFETGPQGCQDSNW